VTSPAAGATFAVIDPDADAGDVAVGPWRVVEGERAEVSFAAPGAPAVERPIVWRVELPAGAGANLTLAAEAAQAEHLDAHLVDAADRVRAVLHARDEGAGVSFAAGGLESSLPEAEAALLADLDGGVSFAAGGDDDEPPGGVSAFLEKLLRRATRMARVETSVAGREVATSDVTLLGDVSTALRLGATDEEKRLHQRTLATTLNTRRAWARIVVQTLQVALLLSSGNVVLALPKAYRFIRSVMGEVKALEGAG